MHRTPDGVIWSARVDLCSQRSGPYADWQGHCPSDTCTLDEGFRVIRRSNRLWAGLSSDLIIEQVLMRSLKTSGGLTRGRGMTEHQRLACLCRS